ncbi:flagellar basal body-associated FliL family protein [Amaricoccus sp.]|uniref:flagellar basal body-associated FliL family protein n=1 Tax=Amaricoccus sp. TaxID=1872485 RepID=UPI001B5FC2FA|nr:flagellar basal body-associated FliL family protein [Amaricoccus sp.]MBP7001960.1 flagellar basal body-associated FliL family protein [Amaricoccus sp.]
MKLAPVAIALLGLGAGVGAGVMLKPAPEAAAAAPECHEGAACPAADPLAAPHGGAGAKAEAEGEASVVPVEKPFVVPVFKGEKVAAMVVVSVAVEIQAAHETAVEELTPRLRDALLAAMFRHANTGGFDGAFTAGRKMEDLRAALLAAARQIFGETPVNDVLITEIARQDV